MAKITINRSEIYNAFRLIINLEMIEEIDHCRENPDNHTVMFTGEGEKVFCTGGDPNNKPKGG
ncbi:enoyl-CoA hydratase-related protein [Xanthovirga aplysinae]|uniref:enoyl-CoA hydratase-related protein n=1 Tax=Xanthovirga aplysinae TaxID=2529853 RepID=UPI001656C574|nr:hypothetical protein [Xanthovirga aplysinae]